MENEEHINFSDSIPLKQGKTVSRYLNSRNPDKWSYQACKSSFIGLFIISATLLGSGVAGIWVAWIALAFLLIIQTSLLKDALNRPVFDFSNGYFYRDWRSPRYGDASTLKDYLPFSQIEGIQFLYKTVSGGKGRVTQAYELNLITAGLQRVFVTDSTNKKKLFEEAQMIARKLGVPLKENSDNKLQSKKTPLWVGIMVLVIFGTFGTMFFWTQAVSPLIKYQQSMTWQPTQAVVVQSRLLSEKRRSKNGSYTVYKADIRYKYHFKGREYIADGNSFFGDGFSRFENSGRRMVKNNPPGKKITCFVDPQKPSRAVMSRKIYHGKLWLNSGISALIILAGLLTFYSVKRRSEE